MEKKVVLKLSLGTMLIIGLVLIAVPFIQSLSVNPKQENAAWGSCDLSDLPKGGLKKCGWVFVYRRTDTDILSINRFAALLADPGSKESEQPLSATNQWRSENKEFFIFKPWAPNRGCEVKLINPRPDFAWERPENEALMELPFFAEQCDGRTWDTSGRLYYREGWPSERNLSVPRVRWVSPEKVLIRGG